MMTTATTASQNSIAMPPKSAASGLIESFCNTSANVDVIVHLLIRVGASAEVSRKSPHRLAAALYTHRGSSAVFFPGLEVSNGVSISRGLLKSRGAGARATLELNEGN